MNKILDLFDEKYVLDLFTREVLPHYPAFKSISRVEIKPYKELVWETTYHVVLGFSTYFLKPDGEEIKIPIVCSAHSEESRDNIYLALKYLRAVKFPTASIDIPDPLFYSEYFQGTFYRGLRGENLLYYIKKKKFSTVTKIVMSAAKVFARLHALPADAQANFNPLNSKIETVIPGVDNILREVGERYGNKYRPQLEKMYHYFIAQEESFDRSGRALTLIHGDAHPENVIVTAPKRVGLIDFTDVCLGDPARDIGSFLQQLKYKVVTKTGDEARAADLGELFLSTYLASAGLEMTPQLQSRIDLYYYWTAIRTATYWLLKAGHNEERAQVLLQQVRERLAL
jgi:aminoglycoside phosphotransferase (APT) family kinase protein